MRIRFAWGKLALGTALAAAALVVGLFAMAPDEACGGHLGCQPDWWTAYGWGSANTCQGAVNNCYNDAYIEAYTVCDSMNKTICAEGTFSPSSCSFSGGLWHVECSLQYKCGPWIDYP